MSTKLRSTAIAATLTDMIREGHFPEGRLWAEDLLCKRMDVSRTTLREALKLLEHDGVISKRHGLANFVHKSTLDVRMRFDKFSDFRQLLEDGGHEVRVDRKIPRPATPEECLAEAGQPLEGPCLFQNTFCIVNNRPASFAANYLHAAPDVYAYYAQEPAPTALHPSHSTLPFTAFMERITGHEQAHSVVYIEPAVADAAVAEAMCIAQGLPIICFVEEHYSLADKLCGVGRVYFDPSVVRLATLRKWR